VSGFRRRETVSLPMMTSRCDRNPTQYERKPQVWHLVHVLDTERSVCAKLTIHEDLTERSTSESPSNTATILNVFIELGARTRRFL